MATPRLNLTKDELRLLTWHRNYLSSSAIPTLASHNVPSLEEGRVKSGTDQTQSIPSSIGSLDVLPLEILRSIFELLDLQSLTDCKAVSWGLRTIATSARPYVKISQHFPEVLRALISTRMASYAHAQDILTALCSAACTGCSAYAPYLDLFTCMRYCQRCVFTSDDTFSMIPRAAKKEFNLTENDMLVIPTFLSLPGTYGRHNKKYKKRLSLVRVKAAFALEQQHSEAPHAEQQARLLSLRHTHEKQHVYAYRNMAMLNIPVLDQQKGELSWGVSCLACREGPTDESIGYDDSKNEYSDAQYLEHFQTCELSQKAREELVRRGEHYSGNKDALVEFIRSFR